MAMFRFKSGTEFHRAICLRSSTDEQLGPNEEGVRSNRTGDTFGRAGIGEPTPLLREPWAKAYVRVQISLLPPWKVNAWVGLGARLESGGVCKGMGFDSSTFRVTHGGFG